MRAKPLSAVPVLAILVVAFLSAVNIQPVYGALTPFTGTLCRSYTHTPQMGIGIDLGFITYCFSQNQISWADDWAPQNNITFNLPRFSGVSLALTTFQNSTTVDYHFTGTVSAKTVTADLYLVQRGYNYKITIRGTVSGPAISLPLTVAFPQSSVVQSGTMVCAYHLCFDYSDSPSASWTASTRILSWTITNSFNLDPIAFDGNGTCNAGASSSCNVGPGTIPNNNELLLVTELCKLENCVAPTDTKGNTWTLRKDYLFGVSTTSDLRVYYAISTSGSDTVTCKKTDTSNVLLCNVVNISGEDTTTIFDPRADLPTTNKGNTVSPSTNAQGNNNPNDMLYSTIGMENLNPTTTVPSGYTSLGGIGTASPVNMRQAYKIVSAVQTATVQWTWSGGGTAQWGQIDDAICQASCNPTTTTTTTTATTSLTTTVTNNLGDPQNYLWLLLIPLFLVAAFIVAKRR